MSEQCPVLKIKSDDGDFITSEITLNGNKIPGLKGIEVLANLPHNNIFVVKLEILAFLDIETPVDIEASIN